MAPIAYALGGALVLLATQRVAAPSVLTIVAGALFVVLGVWLLASERYHQTLAVVMIYLGAADGYVKGKTGSSMITLGRDALLYAIVIGALIRWSVRRERIVFPPLTAWIVFLTALVVAEVFNPGTGGLGHALPAMRPDLEFVPLFFFGYAVMRSRTRLRGFMVMLLALCALNGIVSLVQFNETPAQFASWGPGYAQKINGTGSVAGRTFYDKSGKSYTRPFGLQSDAGGGGDMGMLGIPTAIALLGPLRRRWRGGLMTALLAVGTVLAVVTSQGRGAILATFAALIAYVTLSVVSRRLIPVLGGLVAGGVVTYLVVSVLAANTNSAVFSRYSTITPGNVVSTESSSRGFSLADVPKYAVKYPFGAGLGSSGPASGIGRTAGSFDGETEFTYLITELGVIGFVAFLAFHGRLMLWASLRVRRFRDPELRAMMAALSAPLFGIFALYFGGQPTTGSPLGPYLWFAAGVLVYWFTDGREPQRSGSRTEEKVVCA